ncbi:gamma-glutamyltransferase [Siculibacillus lacustris]|uniref:Glutathione hydrolase proenzyme n=1 Tax=Siculibacillus lacustris TaxID=1549641 RepID=A0A4Q9VRT2_9HYPH|nr:gamma-glutamyltransferase [Siculibacillus lacustris]TBW38637.1 gamma-glutamyltransferase [Siculibacillus lacustris]
MRRPIRRLPAVALLGLLAATAPASAATRPAVEAEHGMVVSANALASAVGAEILRAGGNAVDAAVAVGYALAVVDPCCGNIGGGGFLTLRLADGTARFVDFRETAPAASVRDMYLDAAGRPNTDASLTGWRASGVPGTVAGLDLALARWGSKPRAEVMAPAIRLARDGFVLARPDTDILARGTARLAADPEAARLFLAPGGGTRAPGDRLIQSDLAATLEAIAAGGAEAFYRGPIAAKVAAAMRAHGGTLTEDDFAAYRAVERDPIRCSYRGHRLITAPPPSSGGVTLCLILGVLEGWDMTAAGWHSAAAVHRTVEAMRHAFYLRNTLLGDPDFVTVPVERLLAPAHLAALRARIERDGVLPSAALPAMPSTLEKPETTHYSVVDASGSAVAVTFTVNGAFGAAVVAPGTGFLLNDEMDDFTVKPGTPNLFGLVQGEANAIQPAKRPLSSMTPTIVEKDGRLEMVLGSPGGSRIVSIVAETLTNVIDHGMRPQDAVDAPRFHHQWLPDEIAHEPFALSPDTVALLKAMGYRLVEQTPWGAAELVQTGPAEAKSADPASSGNDSAASGRLLPGRLYGASDDRRPAGAAVGN